jgi:hypothetical protein
MMVSNKSSTLEDSKIKVKRESLFNSFKSGIFNKSIKGEDEVLDNLGDSIEK